MTQGRRTALIVAAVAVAIVAFIVLKPDDKKDSSSSSQTTTQAAPPGNNGQTTATPPSKPAPPPPTEIVVKNAKPVGGVKTIEVSKGDQIRFKVTSDVSDEIHVHGFDFMKDVKAGGSVSFSFPAKMDGEYEVELESRGEQIANLVVNP